MKRIVLLTVAERFQLSGIGLTLAPDFPVQDGWKNLSEKVLVVAPGGSEFKAQAQLNMAHFNFGNTPTSAQRERTWRVVVSLVGVEKANVPIGSQILVSPETHRAVLGGGALDSDAV